MSALIEYHEQCWQIVEDTGQTDQTKYRSKELKREYFTLKISLVLVKKDLTNK